MWYSTGLTVPAVLLPVPSDPTVVGGYKCCPSRKENSVFPCKSEWMWAQFKHGTNLRLTFLLSISVKNTAYPTRKISFSLANANNEIQYLIFLTQLARYDTACSQSLSFGIVIAATSHEPGPHVASTFETRLTQADLLTIVPASHSVHISHSYVLFYIRPLTGLSDHSVVLLTLFWTIRSKS